MKWLFVILFLLMFFLGCGGSETIIRDKKIEFTFPAIKDTVPGKFKEFPKEELTDIKKFFGALPANAHIEGTFEVGSQKQKGKVRYYPGDNRFEVETPPIRADTTFADTTKIVIKEETTIAEKMGWGLIVFVILAAITVFIKLKFFRG